MVVAEGGGRSETLVFEVDGRRYGLEAGEVLEVVRIVETLPLPGAPGWIEGVIDLRGKVVPVIDLRARLGLPVKKVELSDQLIVSRGRGFPIAVRIDRALDLEHLAEGPARVAKLTDGLAPVLDLAGMWNADEWADVHRALFGLADDDKGRHP